MTGDVVPANWRGGLPITYRVGPSSEQVHLAVKSDWSLKTVYDVIAKIEGQRLSRPVGDARQSSRWLGGRRRPIRWRGRWRCSTKPRPSANCSKTGWKPKRTIVYPSWDGEEPGLLGSTEWAETHAAELKKKAVLYINTDSNARGFLYVGGNHDLEHFVNEVTDGRDRSGDQGERRRSDGARPFASRRMSGRCRARTTRRTAKLAADPQGELADRGAGLGLGLFGVPRASWRRHAHARLWRRRP